MSENSLIKLPGADAVTKCKITPLGVTFPANMTFEEWENAGLFFRTVKDSSQFMLGDWLNFGEGVYGDRFAQALDATDYEEKSIQDLAWVCRSVPIEVRKANLGFTFHRLVAKLDPFVQEAELNFAIEQKEKLGKYTRQEFEVHLKEQYAPRSNVPGSGSGSVVGLPANSDYKNALIYIRDMVSEREIGSVPKKDDIQWMLSAINAVKKSCAEVVGVKRK